MVTLFKALADSTRLRLLNLLAQAELTVQELTAILDMGQSRISRHLKILLEAGILAVKSQGTWNYYRCQAENRLFSEIWPALHSHMGDDAVLQSDLAVLASLLDERRRRSLEFFEQHAGRWDELSRNVVPTPDYRRTLVDLLPEGEQLAELGIGTGQLLELLAPRSKRLVGIDNSASMLDRARQRVAENGFDNCELRLGELAHLPFADGEMDGALLNMVLHHAAQPEVVLGEAARIIRPGGRLVIADLQKHEQDTVRESMGDLWLGFHNSELQEWLRSSGFRTVETIDIPPRSGEFAVLLVAADKN